VDLDGRTRAAISRHESRHEALQGLGRRADPEDPAIAPAQLAGTLAQRLRIRQELTAAQEQVLPVRAEPDATTNAVEQAHAQF
jgi:hypothetical protein